MSSVKAVETIAGRAAGLRVRDKDLDALAAWTAARVRALALAGSERYAAMLAEDSAEGER